MDETICQVRLVTNKVLKSMPWDAIRIGIVVLIVLTVGCSSWEVGKAVFSGSPNWSTIAATIAERCYFQAFAIIATMIGLYFTGKIKR